MGNQKKSVSDQQSREQVGGCQPVDSEKGSNSLAALGERSKIKVYVVSMMLRAIQPAIIKQLNDLRTSVTKEACALIVWIAQEYPHEFCLQMTKQ